MMRFLLFFCRLLTIKLENNRIKGQVLDIIRYFLPDRTLRTSMRGCYSTIRNFLSGVPHSAGLCPWRLTSEQTTLDYCFTACGWKNELVHFRRETHSRQLYRDLQISNRLSLLCKRCF